jgi:hypothetical protein
VLRPAETAQVAALRREAPVAEVLQPFVERYWSVRWDRTGQPPFRSEVLSHPSVNVSVEAGTAPRFGVRLPAVLVHGVVTRRFTVDLVGAGRVVFGAWALGGPVAVVVLVAVPVVAAGLSRPTGRAGGTPTASSPPRPGSRG